MDSVCSFCVNQKTVNKEFECKTSRCDENCKKNLGDGQNSQQLRKQTDELIKTCQRSISYIYNQQIYMKQFIEHQVASLIQQLHEREVQLQNILTETLQKKMDFYVECESRLTNIKKNQDYGKLKQQPFFQLEAYSDDKIMDFSNIKILSDEIKSFGKRITKKANKSQTQNLMIKKNINQDDKENQMECMTKSIKSNINNQFYSFLPDLSECQLFYKLGQKFQLPKHNKIIGFVYTNSCKFGWYYECQDPVIGYNNCVECYIFSLENIQNIPPMKFYPKDGHYKYCLNLQHQKIGFGKECRDLVLDFENLSNCSSTLGQTYDMYSNLDGEYVLAGKPNNWNIDMIEIFYFK